MAFQPKFARPKSCVTTFSSEQKFIEWLLGHKVPYWEWGEEVRSKAWKEVEEGDAVYYYDARLKKAVRFICVIAARVTMKHPRLGHLVLTEYVRKGDWYQPRRQRDSSLSEKVLLNRVTGEAVEKPIETIARCFEQELSLSVSIEELKNHRSVKFLPWNHSSGIVGDSHTKVEIDPALSEKRVGVRDFRQVAHYTVDLSPKHYRTGYQDPQTRYFSRFHSIDKGEAVIDPIPAEGILNKNWAVAC